MYQVLKKEHSENVRHDKIGNKNMRGYGCCLKNIKTGELIRKKLDRSYSVDWVKWSPKINRTIAFHDPDTDKEYRFGKNDVVPKNLIEGRSDSFRKKISISSKGNSSNKGMIIIHNPDSSEERYIKKGEKIPENFVLGHSEKHKRLISNSALGRKANNIGKLRYHNPATNNIIQISKNDPVPLGYIRGMPESFSEKIKIGMIRADPSWKDRLILRNKSRKKIK